MKLFKIFIGTLLLGIAFGILFLCLLCLAISLGHTKHMALILMISPIPLGFGACFLVHRKTFRVNKDFLRNQASKRRFFIRLISVAAVLIAGLYPSTQIKGAGGYPIPFLLCDYVFYLLIAAFLLVFSTTEFFFASPGNSHTACPGS